ncbi:MAG: hypothetical protein WCS94_18530, partial [Verrucomicrobiota bacterium]
MRRFLGRNESGIGQPGFDGTEVVGFHAIQVRAPDAKESPLLIQHRRQFVAVGQQHTAMNARAVSQTDEGGKFAP